MTPEEAKAREIVDSIRYEFNWVEDEYPVDLYRDTMECALKFVGEIIEEVREYCDFNFHQSRLNYWNNVKQEILKL